MKIFVTVSRFKDDNKLGNLKIIIDSLLDKKIDGIRINFAKLNTDEIIDYALAIKDLFENRYTDRFELLFDMPYPFNKTRILEHNVNNSSIIKGNCYYISENTGKIIDHTSSIILDSKITRNCNVGDLVLFGDGEGAFLVIRNQPNLLDVVALNDFFLIKNKSLNCGLKHYEYSNLIFDACNILASDKYKYKFALSFVQEESDILEFIKNVEFSDGRIISKIETDKGVENLSKILELSCGVLVARGDLCIYSDPVKLLANTLTIVEEAKKYSKQLLVATDILKSMKERIVPNRSDLADVSNLSLIGCEVFVLSHEFSISDNLDHVINLLYNIDNYYRNRSEI